eukprot:PhF_6_TR6927/c0_g1_i1/m.10115/K19758/DYX1C1, DNAAF4; dyslexia susceptibility 1 candidate gene 1 protein
MPLIPEFKVDELGDSMQVSVILKGVKRAAIDVVINESFLKVSAPPYLFQADLKHEITPSASHHRQEEKANGSVAVVVTLKKVDPTIIWETLFCPLSREERAARRAEASEKNAAAYNAALEQRKSQKEKEEKRYFHEKWDNEKQLRAEIETKAEAEKEQERAALYEWQQNVDTQPSTTAEPTSNIRTTSNNTNNNAIFTDVLPDVRGGDETKMVRIDLTPKIASLPARTRGDEDYYRKSKYKPQNIEDTPMFWKDKGDGYFRRREYKDAANAYSEAVKRDGCFVSCVANRAACWLMLHRYDKCVEDCDLAMTMVNNTPASDTSGERYRAALMKLHARRGAAYLWKGELLKALSDYQMAVAYRVDMLEHAELVQDLQMIQSKCKELGLVQQTDPRVERRNNADAMYLKGDYDGAITIYNDLLESNPHDYKARSNKCACLLHLGRNKEVIQETNQIVSFCQDIANAIHSGVTLDTVGKDSDDEDEVEGGGGEDKGDELLRQRRIAANMVKDKSGHVYLLLKAYVRQGAAFCGMKDYASGLECFERALRITPYDDDLRADTMAVMEKMKLHAVIDAAKSKPSSE